MAYIQWYDRPKVLHKKLALHDGVQDSLEHIARGIYSQAKTIHSFHRDEGHSEVFLEHPGNSKAEVDWHVGISDVRGQKAAIAIEYGTYRSQGTYTLHRAAGLAPRRTAKIPKKMRPKRRGRR